MSRRTREVRLRDVRVRAARAVITGFHGAQPLRAGETPWREWSDADAGILRSEFAEAAVFEADENAPFSGALSCAARQLVRLGLLEKGGLTLDAERVAVCFSSSKGDMHALRSFGNGGCDAPLSHWRETIGARGTGLAPVAACATGAHCVAFGAQLIEDGYADVAICGAWEAEHSELVLAGYRSLGALSKSGIMRPFDHNRDGFVPSAGAAMLVLENESFARRRGVPILGAVSGYSMQSDASAMTSMCASGDTIARAIELALNRAGNPRVDYVNAHGTATQLNDEIESRAVRSVWGRAVPCSSTKPMTGHWLGAAGALEAQICLMAMREKWAPPTKNVETPDENCDLDYISKGREMPIECAVSLSYGFGGHIGVLVLERE